jgi:hypothetical protein
MKIITRFFTAHWFCGLVVRVGDGEFVGETIIESRWPKGYGKMTVVEASQIRR